MTLSEAYAIYRIATDIALAIDKLIRKFWIFVLWRRKVRVIDVLEAIQKASEDPTIRNAMLSVPHSRQLLDEIDRNRRDLNEFADAFRRVTRPMKLMLYQAKIVAEETADEALREQFREDYVSEQIGRAHV